MAAYYDPDNPHIRQRLGARSATHSRVMQSRSYEEPLG
jgi:hypothetical protein